MIETLIFIINVVAKILVWAVILKIILSYFMDPFHPFRQTLDSFIEPLLMPIRQIVPPFGMMDFSPMVLIIIVELLSSVLRNLLLSLIM